MRKTAVPMFVLVVVCSGACGPEPIVARPDGGRPRALPAGAENPVPAREVGGPDGGTSRALPADGCAQADAAVPRDKLPSPDAGAHPDTADADAGADAAAARAPRAGELAVVEALVNPAGQDLGREWIEIVSLAAEPLDLSALHVADAAVDVAAPAGLVAPGGRVVAGQSADAAMNGGAPVSVAYGTRLMLNNGGEEVSLCLGACAEGVVLDRVTWGDLGAAYDGHALVLDRSAALVCPSQQPFGTAGDFGTPGAPDGSCASPDGGF
jgi:hypothetical protein